MNQHEEVRTRLLEQRTVLITTPLDTVSGTGATAALMLLDADGDDPIHLRLLGRDGDLDAALALADTLDAVAAVVLVQAMGTVGGALLAPFAAGTRRVASRHATFILTDPHPIPSVGGDPALEAVNHQRQLGVLHQRLAAACGVPLDDIVDDMRRGRVLNAPEAETYGLVDAVVPARP